MVSFIGLFCLQRPVILRSLQIVGTPFPQLRWFVILLYKAESIAWQTPLYSRSPSSKLVQPAHQARSPCTFEDLRDEIITSLEFHFHPGLKYHFLGLFVF